MKVLAHFANGTSPELDAPDEFHQLVEFIESLWRGGAVHVDVPVPGHQSMRFSAFGKNSTHVWWQPRKEPAS